MTKADEFMADLINEAVAKKNESGLSRASAHGEFNGHKVSVRVMEVRTNSKSQINKNWKVDGKVCGAANVSEKIQIS